MQHNSTANLQHDWHYSFNDLKKYMVSHEDLFDNIFEKSMETVGIIMVAGLIFMIILAVDTLNHANQAYSNGLACIFCNALQNLMYNAMEIFM